MNNLKEAKNPTKFSDQEKTWGKYNQTDDAKALVNWISNLPSELKELGFTQIKRYRVDKTYVQAKFEIEAAYGVAGPYEKQYFQDLLDEALPVAEKAFLTYLDDDRFLEEWENADEEAKKEMLKNVLENKEMDDFKNAFDALMHYERRHPGSLPNVKVWGKGDGYETLLGGKEFPFRAAQTKDVRNSSGDLRYTELEFTFTLERTKDNTVYYNFAFGKNRWQGTTMSELEADWDDFLVNNLANYLGA